LIAEPQFKAPQFLNSSKRCPQFLNDYFYFNRDIVQKKTRQSNHLLLPSVKLECTKKPFIIIIILLIVFCDKFLYAILRVFAN